MSGSLVAFHERHQGNRIPRSDPSWLSNIAIENELGLGVQCISGKEVGPQTGIQMQKVLAIYVFSIPAASKLCFLFGKQSYGNFHMQQVGTSTQKDFVRLVNIWMFSKENGHSKQTEGQVRQQGEFLIWPHLLL